MNGTFVAYGQAVWDWTLSANDVTDYLNGGRWELLAEFTEIETGKRDDRPGSGLQVVRNVVGINGAPDRIKMRTGS